jgi:transposase
LLPILVAMVDHLLPLMKQILDIVRQEKAFWRLMSIPGVGPITALALRATIDQPDRFRRSRDVARPSRLNPVAINPARTDQVDGSCSRHLGAKV